MWRGVAAHFRRVFIAAKNPHPRQILANHPTNYLYCASIAPFSSSSSSRKSSSLRNYYIRKRRKWPIEPYQTQWHQAFTFRLAKHSFKQSIRKTKTHLLADLINSFATFEIDPTPQSYHFLFKILIQKKPTNCHDQIRQILHHIEKVEILEIPECVFIDLIKFYGESNMFDDAVELFFRMHKYRCDPSVEVLNALLLVLCRNKRGIGLVSRVLVKSRVMKIRIEESSFGILIRALCGMGSVSSAFELLNHMVEEGFSVDQKVCSLMFATMCRQLECNGDEVVGFLEDLKKLGFEPRKDDLRNVIRFLVKKGKGLDALEVLKQMTMNGNKPDIMCYNLVLDGLIRNREFLRADIVFDELLVLGLIPDICTYSVYINGLCMQKKVEDGINMLGSMEELGCIPDLSIYNLILRALCEVGEMDRVIEVVNDMRQKCIQLNLQTYDVLVDGFISNGDVNGACSLLSEMLDKNFIPQTSTLGKIIRWLCKSGLHVKAAEVLVEVAVKDIA